MQNFLIPPIICMLVVDKAMVGSYDNPADLLEALDNHLDSLGKNKFSDTKALKDIKIKMFFSVLNITNGMTTCNLIKENDIKDPLDIKQLYNIIIDKYRLELVDAKYNENEFDTSDIRMYED